MRNQSTRRAFIAGGIAASIAAVTYSEENAPSAARQTRAGFRTLTAKDAATLNALGDTLVPGSARHGLARYVDRQLSGPTGASMLMIKYLNVSEPFHTFYGNGLRAMDALAMRRFGQPFPGLNRTQSEMLVKTLAHERPQEWQGPPPPLFYFVVKADAVDVTYGTSAGFKSLGIPYMAHIAPPTPWGE